MIFVKEHIVELPLIDHFSASVALIEVPFLGLAQLVKVSGIHFRKPVLDLDKLANSCETC
jgi:hypothetical protein